MRIDWQAAHHGVDNSDWLLQGTINARVSPDIKGQDFLQTGIGLSHGWMDATTQEYHAVLAVQNLQYSGRDIQRTLRSGLYQGQHWQASTSTNCSANYGAEWEMLVYPSARELNGQYLGIAADLSCKQKLDWQLLLRVGIDQAEHRRPGGD